MDAINKNKIAIVDWVGVKAGMDEYDLGLGIALINEGVSILLLSNFIAKYENLISKNIFSAKPFGLFSIPRLMLALFQLKIELKNFKPQLVIIHIFKNDWLTHHIVKIIDKIGLQTILIIHDVEPLIENTKSNLYPILKNKKVIVHSQYALNELQKKNIEGIHITMLPHGNYLHSIGEIKNSVALPFNLNSQITYLLLFGQIKNSKGWKVAVQSLKLLPQNIHLLLVGKPRDVNIKEIKKYIDATKMNNRITFHPYHISIQERDYLFKNTHIVLLPYLKIYQSGVLLLAMSYKKPIVLSDIDANKEILIDGVDGTFFANGDATDLSNKIQTIATDKTKLNTMSIAAFNKANTKYTWSIMACAINNILTK